MLGATDQFRPAVIRNADGSLSGLTPRSIRRSKSLLSRVDGVEAVPLVLLARRDKPFITRLDSLPDRPVGAREVDPILPMLRRAYPRLELVELADGAGLDALERVRVYALALPLEPALGATGSRVLSFKIIAEPDRGYPISVAVRDDWPEQVAILDRAIASLAEAEHGAIRQRWRTRVIEERPDYRLLWQGTTAPWTSIGVRSHSSRIAIGTRPLRFGRPVRRMPSPRPASSPTPFAAGPRSWVPMGWCPPSPSWRMPCVAGIGRLPRPRLPPSRRDWTPCLLRSPRGCRARRRWF